MPFTIGPKTHNKIPQELKILIDEFFSLRNWEGLYLTGGTCLSEYYFGHRLSEDIDLFTQDKLLLQEAKIFLSDPENFRSGTITKIRETPYISQFHYRKKKSERIVKVDLVLDMPQRISSPLPIGHVWVDNLDDILSNKMGCMISRNEVKDYLDLFYLIPASHLTTKELMTIGLIKEGGLDPLILARQMDFIFHISPPSPLLLGKTNWQELQLLFKKLQKECLEIIRP